MNKNYINENFNKNSLIRAYDQIKPYIHKTPVLTSGQLNRMAGTEVLFKCENFQKTGSFKIRGALNAVLNLPEEKKQKGVVTHSSGNFAQALSLAANYAGINSYIVMPENAPEVKKSAVKCYGGKIYGCIPTLSAREQTAERIRQETGAEFIHPYNDNNVICGQGTAAMELLKDQPELECIIAPVGGGGLISGTVLAAEYFSAGCEVFGGEPFEADDAHRSLEYGKIIRNKKADTVADGLRTNLGSRTFPVISEGVKNIIRVTENDIIETMKLIWERMKIVIEPSGAVAFAAVLKHGELFNGKKTGVIISGGNIDSAKLSSIFQ
ncbi:MAG: pyridoxal-phosphate dependent enzyme [Victivallales bacterium]|nr:pyridoxal-phosphate dependent enzyme [Victivallales bacterium]